MALDDLHLHRDSTEGPPQPPARRAASPARWIVVGAVVVASAALVYLWWLGRATSEPVTPAPAAPTEVAVQGHRPKRQPIELPALDASDILVRELVATLSQHPLLARLLANPALVRTAVLTVEEVGDGKTPAAPLAALRPTGRLALIGSGSEGRVDARSYTRWDPAAEALSSVRPNEAAQLYVNLKPLFDEAYRGLGHPDSDFDTGIIRAIQMVEDTPEPSAELTLLRLSGSYEHTDLALKSLPPLQKQLLLLGPENRRRVKDWLTRFAEALDLKI